MTEQATPFASMGYEPVGAVQNKLIARYLRTQRKNMRRLFAERGLYELTDRMNQIRNSRQGMLAKNRMFQEVLNSYAAQTMPPRAEIQRPVEPLQDVRPAASEGVAAKASGESEVSVDSVEDSQPRTHEGDLEQISRLPDADQTVAEDL